MTESTPDFNALGEAEKKAVAERLLRIKESGWKPFWCPITDCDGMPHWAVVDDGDGPVNTFVDETDLAGPNGEPVGEMQFEDADGNWFESTGKFAQTPAEGDTPIGRPVLDPAWAHNHARVDQRLPGWLKPWILFIMSGRGSGKTTTGVEFVTLCARRGLDGAILGRRGTELVNTHVAEIINRAHPEFVPIHWASKDILEWPNGAITYLFSAEKPENIRSVNLSYAWVDEAAFMDEIETAWMNLKLATRIEKPDNPIHFLITSTPTATPWVMSMEDDPDVEVRRVSTYANRANLGKSFLEDLERSYEGTRMGRQEIYGEVLRDVEGSLWNDDMFTHERALTPRAFDSWLDAMDDRVLAVDPAGSKGARSDATGIIGVGAQHLDDAGAPLASSAFTVLGDATIKGSPNEWCARVFSAARMWRVNRIVAEKNFGGDMVKQVLSDWAALNPQMAKDDDGMDFRIEVVHAASGQSKETRAEPVVAKYEQGRVTHLTSSTLYGDLSAMEREQVTWVPKSRGGRMPSPNRIDALVWAVRALETKVKHRATFTTSRDVMKKMTLPGRTAAGAPAARITTGVSGNPRWERSAPKTFPVKVRGR